MNKRICALMEQADLYARSDNSSMLFENYKKRYSEKFVELIVQECLGDVKERIARRYQGSEQDRDIGYGMEIVYFDIIDKFGVKE